VAPILASFASGLIFGPGLIVSQMINPAKVLAFLDIFGASDPSLAFVMAGAVVASVAGCAYAKRRGVPVFASRLNIPNRRDVDPRLLTGAALFGIGWGLVGLCPGPALTILPLGLWQAFVFVAAMLAGMLLFRFVPAEWAQSSFRRDAQQADA
jgi:uncharacterized membrane protein YedE/YeeE